MTKEQYFTFAEDFFSQCLAISRKKNADYTGIATDPFANFTAVEGISISTIDGFLTRMMDKMQRVSSFNKLGSLQVKDESVTDTLRDLANYSCLLAGYIKSRQEPVSATTKFINDLKFMGPAANDLKEELLDSQIQFKAPEKDCFDDMRARYMADKAGIFSLYGKLGKSSMHEKISNNPFGIKTVGRVEREGTLTAQELMASLPEAVSLMNTKDEFISNDLRTELVSHTYGTYNGVKAVRTKDGNIYPYFGSDDFGNGPGMPIK